MARSAAEQANIAFNGGTDFGNNIAGTLTVTGSTLSNGFSGGLDVQADAGIVTDATISNDSVTNPGAGPTGRDQHRRHRQRLDDRSASLNATISNNDDLAAPPQAESR